MKSQKAKQPWLIYFALLAIVATVVFIYISKTTPSNFLKQEDEVSSPTDASREVNPNSGFRGPTSPPNMKGPTSPPPR